MVVNLCLPHFHTTVHCNKLCADGYDVTNLVSADPTLRRRGFKLEYFLRPPVQVTLKFGFKVELCRVDVELWPWGLDRGQACKRLEISTSSDQLLCPKFAQGHKPSQKKEQRRTLVKDQNGQNREKHQEHDSKSCHSNGSQWSLQAHQWGEKVLDEPQRRGHVSDTEFTDPEAEFKLVGRCELREETRACFTRSKCNPRPPFPAPPPPQPENCRQEELWSRGLLSLGAVTQLRVTVPFGGAASAQGLKALTVWGQPAGCCSAEEVEGIQRVHEASERRQRRPALVASSFSQAKRPQQAAVPSNDLSVPEEFLDPITQEIMLLPMLLPSGVSVDNSTLEEHQKTEATWGRPPNDPFTGVPFTSTSQPLPNPQLKGRIDHFLLQKGMMKRDGMLGRQGGAEDPQASRLIAFKAEGQTLYSPCLRRSPTNDTAIPNNSGTGTTKRTTQTDSQSSESHTSNAQHLTTDRKSELQKRNKQDFNVDSIDGVTAEEQLLPQAKRPRNDAVSLTSSHEQRLSASLDEALFSALQGRPSFTSNLSQQRPLTLDPKPPNTSTDCRTAAGAPAMLAGEKTCSACSCSVSVYSKSASSIYRLACGHLLCRPCLRRDSQPSNSTHMSCPACQSLSPRSDIVRVHH